jgi:hypothetical protein
MGIIAHMARGTMGCRSAQFGLAALCVFAASGEGVVSNLVFTPSRRVHKEKPQIGHYLGC